MNYNSYSWKDDYPNNTKYPELPGKTSNTENKLERTRKTKK